MHRRSRPPTPAVSARSPLAGRRPGVTLTLPSRRPRGATSARRRPSRRSIVVAVAVALGLTAASCGSDTATTDPTTTTSALGTTAPKTEPPSTSAPTSTTTTPDGDEAEVRAVIDRYWPAFLNATADPDADNAELQAVLTGEASARIIGSIEDLRDNGQRVVAPDGSVFSHEVISVTFEGADRAVVKECVIDDLMIVDAAGEPINDAVTTSEYTSTLFRSENVWRIGRSERTKRLEGVHECSALQ